MKHWYKLEVAQIARRLGRTEATIYYQAKKLGLPPKRPKRMRQREAIPNSKGPNYRKCLCCLQQFWSSHPGNRMCGECRELARIML